MGGKCVDVTSGDSSNGIPIELWDCWDGPNQRWALTPDAGVQPISGVQGYTLATEYRFGTGPGANVTSIADLEALFTYDAPWGRINGELESFQPFNAQNHVFEADDLALVPRHDGSGNYTEFGHITSGALVSKLTVKSPCVVEIVAQIPSARGVWPSLWLFDMQSGHNDGSEIDFLESQYNAPIGQRDDRSMVYQNDHGAVGATLSNPGGLDQFGRWQPYGPMPGGDMSTRFAAYSVHWQSDRVTKYVDNKEGVTRAFTWTGPSDANVILYDSVGSDQIDWTGPVFPETFDGDNATFRIKTIRVFTP